MTTDNNAESGREKNLPTVSLPVTVGDEEYASEVLDTDSDEPAIWFAFR
jgi:hypothetical protein